MIALSEAQKSKLRENVIIILGPKEDISVAKIRNILNILMDVLVDYYEFSPALIVKFATLFVSRVTKMIKK